MFRFLDSHHCRWDSNLASFLILLYLKNLQRESNPFCEDLNPWPLFSLLLPLGFKSIWWRFESSCSNNLFGIEIRIQSTGIRILAFMQTSWNWDSNLVHRGFESVFLICPIYTIWNWDSNPLFQFGLFCLCLFIAQMDSDPIVGDLNLITRKHILSVLWWIFIKVLIINLKTLN